MQYASLRRCVALSKKMVVCVCVCFYVCVCMCGCVRTFVTQPTRLDSTWTCGRRNSHTHYTNLDGFVGEVRCCFGVGRHCSFGKTQRSVVEHGAALEAQRKIQCYCASRPFTSSTVVLRISQNPIVFVLVPCFLAARRIPRMIITEDE